MAKRTRKIGLSLGADLCWPAAYEELVRALGLKLHLGEDVVDFVVERVTVEPFDLQQPCSYDVVIDRLTHWFTTSREWIKKAVILDGLYVLNNPWAVQSMEKQTTYVAMMKLGLAVPRTILVPPRVHAPSDDLQPTLDRYARLFNLGDVARDLGYPLFMKPYDGGGWRGVTRIQDEAQLRSVYDESGAHVMHLQEAIEPFDLFVRTIGVGPQVRAVRYDPAAPQHARYQVDFHFMDGPDWDYLTDQMLTINGFFGWDFNSCESLRKDGIWHPIDFANACPDFQVTSLHYHWPGLLKDVLRWTLFCAATQRSTQPTLSWEPYFAVARKDLPLRERVAAYAAITRERMDADAFQAFCDEHLAHLDEVVWEFLGTPRAREVVHGKVSALYPEHEVESFTAHFWGLVQFWRKTEVDRLAATPRPLSAEAQERAPLRGTLSGDDGP